MYFRCRTDNITKRKVIKKVDEIKSAEWDIEVPQEK